MNAQPALIEPEAPVRTYVNFAEVVARRKLGKGDDYHMAGWECVGKTSDLIVSMGPHIGVKTRGPYKGCPKWGVIDKCVVSQSEEQAEKLRYEADTGTCSGCCGHKVVWAGWNHITGSKYRDCRRCNATGVAP